MPITVQLPSPEHPKNVKVLYDPRLAVMGDDRYCKDLNFVVNPATKQLIALVVSCSQVFNVLKDNCIQKFIDLLTVEFKILGCEVILGKFTIILSKNEGFILEIRSADFAKVLECSRHIVTQQTVMQTPFINLNTIENLVTKCFNRALELQRTGRGMDLLPQASRYDLLTPQGQMAMGVRQPRDAKLGAKRTHSRMSLS